MAPSRRNILPMHIYIYIFIYIITTHIAKLLNELRSRVLDYPKIKLSPWVHGFVVVCAVPSMMLPFYIIYILVLTSMIDYFLM